MQAKHLITLAALTGLFVIAALFAVINRDKANMADFPAQLLFPALEQQIDSAAKITLETAQTKIIAARDPKGGGWNLPERGGWPANFDTVRQTVLALAKLTAMERRTARAENHAALLLNAPGSAGKNGQGFRITAENAQGETLAALIIGKVQTPPSGTRLATAYVRRQGEDQTYLAQGDVNIPLLMADWIDRVLFDLAADRIRSVTITPPSGTKYEISRTDAKAPFVISSIPKGKELVLADLPENIAKAVSLLPLDDAMPADGIDFSGAFRAEHRTFDGLVLISETVRRDNARWTRFEPRFDPAQAESANTLMAANPALLKAEAVQKQIAEIIARTEGWAFRLPGMKAADLTRDYDGLFKTPEPEKKSDDGQPETGMEEYR